MAFTFRNIREDIQLIYVEAGLAAARTGNIIPFRDVKKFTRSRRKRCPQCCHIPGFPPRGYIDPKAIVPNTAIVVVHGVVGILYNDH
jgi:hypothetical protein